MAAFHTKVAPIPITLRDGAAVELVEVFPILDTREIDPPAQPGAPVTDSARRLYQVVRPTPVLPEAPVRFGCVVASNRRGTYCVTRAHEGQQCTGVRAVTLAESLARTALATALPPLTPNEAARAAGGAA